MPRRRAGVPGAFGDFYLTTFANFGNVYGFLLSAFVAVEHLHLAALIFLVGLVVDRLLEQES